MSARTPTTPSERQPVPMPRPAADQAPRGDISARSAIVLFFAVGSLIYLGWILRNALLLIYFSIVVAVLLTPFVDRVAQLRVGRWRLGRGMGILLLAMVCAGLLTLFFVFAVPPIQRDATQMVRDLPRIISDLAHKAGNLPVVNRI